MVPLAMMGGMAQTGTGGGIVADPRLKPAAHEFEACLMKEFLEPLQRDALFNDGKGEDSSDGSGNALMSFGSEALARAISDGGGFGIATKIIGQLEKKPDRGGAAGEAEKSPEAGKK